jgi:hypothetical protein
MLRQAANYSLQKHRSAILRDWTRELNQHINGISRGHGDGSGLTAYRKGEYFRQTTGARN